jgi:protein-disulfide isomerase
VTRGVAKGGGGAVAGGAGAAPVAVQHAAVNVPGAAPDWVERQMEAEGTGTAKGSQLKAARAAEADATNKLRAKLDPLQLTSGQTIAQAVAADKTLENALDRALVKARTTNVEYHGLDSATAKVQLDLRDVWREIESATRR